MISGNKVYLTAIEPEHLDELMEWRNRPHFRKYFREYREISSAMQQKWYEKTVLSDNNTIMFSIFNAESCELIGCCGLCYINWIHRFADLSLYIGYNDEYIDTQGFAEEACNLLFKYAFDELNLHKIWTEIYDIDLKKQELYDRLGMKVDGRLRDNYYYEGEWHESLIYSILTTDWRQRQ